MGYTPSGKSLSAYVLVLTLGVLLRLIHARSSFVLCLYSFLTFYLVSDLFHFFLPNISHSPPSILVVGELSLQPVCVHLLTVNLSVLYALVLSNEV